MEREEFKILVKAMKAVYAQQTFIPDQDAFNVWYAFMKDLDYEQVHLAIQKYMATERFPPAISDILQKANEIVMPEEDTFTELEAWDLVRKAIRNSGYHAEEEFAKLPESCKIAVGSPANLREWAVMETKDVETVGQSHFVRNYRVAQKRIIEDAMLPVHIRDQIGRIKENAATVLDRKAAVENIEEKSEENRQEGYSRPPKNWRERIKNLFKELEENND